MTAQKPDIIETIRNEGIELKAKGRNFWACCPFHAEKTPSFAVNPEWQTFKCFGCLAHGDSISFIQQYKGISFKNACKYLGLNNGKLAPEAAKEIQRQKDKAARLAKFRQWVDARHGELCDFYRELQILKMSVKTPADLTSGLAYLYREESQWVNCLDILEGRDDEAKFRLYFSEANENAKRV